MSKKAYLTHRIIRNIGIEQFLWKHRYYQYRTYEKFLCDVWEFWCSAKWNGTMSQYCQILNLFIICCFVLMRGVVINTNGLNIYDLLTIWIRMAACDFCNICYRLLTPANFFFQYDLNSWTLKKHRRMLSNMVSKAPKFYLKKKP